MLIGKLGKYMKYGQYALSLGHLATIVAELDNHGKPMFETIHDEGDDITRAIDQSAG